MGATSGIGKEVAILLADKGWIVGIAGRRTELLQRLQTQHKGIACWECIDVTQDDASGRLLQLIDRLGGMDLYFHSSGIGWQNNSLDEYKEMKTMQTNGLGFVRMVTASFNWFAQHEGGHLACITSIAGTKGLGAAPVYSATKRFQSHYLECLSQQANMRHLPIHITDIRPGFVATDLIAGSHYPLQLKVEIVARRIVEALEKKNSVVIIDWRYRLLVGLWRLVPRWLWTRLRITK